MRSDIRISRRNTARFFYHLCLSILLDWEQVPHLFLLLLQKLQLVLTQVILHYSLARCCKAKNQEQHVLVIITLCTG